eukprot:6485931-Amphidinium_carterae.1
MDGVKRQTIPIIDANYIEHQLDKAKLLEREAEKRKQTKLQRLLQQYATRNADLLQRNEERRERRERREGGVEPDERVPQAPTLPDTYEPFTDDERRTINEFTDAFNYYSKLFQYLFNK